MPPNRTANGSAASDTASVAHSPAPKWNANGYRRFGGGAGGRISSTNAVTNGIAQNSATATRAPRIPATERRDNTVGINTPQLTAHAHIQPSRRAIWNPVNVMISGVVSWIHGRKNAVIPSAAATSSARRPRRQYSQPSGSYSGFSGQSGSRLASYDGGSLDICSSFNPHDGQTFVSPTGNISRQNGHASSSVTMLRSIAHGPRPRPTPSHVGCPPPANALDLRLPRPSP